MSLLTPPELTAPQDESSPILGPAGSMASVSSPSEVVVAPDASEDTIMHSFTAPPAKDSDSNLSSPSACPPDRASVYPSSNKWMSPAEKSWFQQNLAGYDMNKAKEGGAVALDRLTNKYFLHFNEKGLLGNEFDLAKELTDNEKIKVGVLRDHRKTVCSLLG
jgi:hypothetical protein